MRIIYVCIHGLSCFRLSSSPPPQVQSTVAAAVAAEAMSQPASVLEHPPAARCLSYCCCPEAGEQDEKQPRRCPALVFTTYAVWCVQPRLVLGIDLYSSIRNVLHSL